MGCLERERALWHYSVQTELFLARRQRVGNMTTRIPSSWRSIQVCMGCTPVSPALGKLNRMVESLRSARSQNRNSKPLTARVSRNFLRSEIFCLFSGATSLFVFCRKPEVGMLHIPQTAFPPSWKGELDRSQQERLDSSGHPSGQMYTKPEKPWVEFSPSSALAAPTQPFSLALSTLFVSERWMCWWLPSINTYKTLTASGGVQSGAKIRRSKTLGCTNRPISNDCFEGWKQCKKIVMFRVWTGLVSTYSLYHIAVYHPEGTSSSIPHIP